MFFRKKHKKAKKEITSTGSANVKDYSNDPFVVKKIEASKKIIEKYGFPKELITG